jgi:hypothetical protein
MVLEFVVMATINAGLVTIFSVILPWMSGTSIDSPAVLFGVLLLTLLVTLYDRFKPYQQVRAERARLTSL